MYSSRVVLVSLALGFLSPCVLANPPLKKGDALDDAVVTNLNYGPAISSLVADKKTVAGKQWQADVRNGKVRLLHGAVSKPYGADAETASKAFLGDAHTALGLKADLSDLRTLRADRTETKNHVRFQQTLNGVPVLGAQVTVHSNKDGAVSMVQSTYVENPVIGNRELIDADEAASIAKQDLLATKNIDGVARAEKQLIKTGDVYRYVWKVTVSAPFAYWIYRIDAETAAIEYKGNHLQSVKPGQGNVYVNNPAWEINRVSGATLRTMYTPEEGNAGNYLWGLRADIYDNNGNDPQSSDYTFRYRPDTGDWLEKDYFDAVTAYYHTNMNWEWWDKNLIKHYALSAPDYFYDYSIPSIVSVAGLCNAFYTPDIDGAGNPGFVFGDDDACGAGWEDLALDSDVYRHEFAHAMMDWAGFDIQYGGNLDGYGRSMGEGNADWYAFLASPKNLDPRIGEVAFALSTDGYLRNLDSTRMYPRDVDMPGYGGPEEHYTGEIWGGYLYDLFRVMKGRAIPYVFQSSYYFSEVGGHQAAEADFYDGIYAQMIAEQDLTGKLTNTAAAWGSMASRGLNAVRRTPYSHASDYFASGSAGTDDTAWFALNFPAITAVKTRGNVLVSNDVHEYIIQTTVADLDLTVILTPEKLGPLNNPVVTLYTLAGTQLASATMPAAGIVTLPYIDLPAGVYVITVTGNTTATARGYYALSVGVK